MANYTQYIPQTGTTTYPASISNCFAALTGDVTALESDKVNLASGTEQVLLSDIKIEGFDLTLKKDSLVFDWIRPSAGVGAEAKIRVYDDTVFKSDFGWNFSTSNWYFNNALTITSGDLTLSAGNLDVTGNIIVSGTVDGFDISTISSFGGTLIDDANAAAAVTTLGFTSTSAEVNGICAGKTLTTTDDKIDNFPAGTLMLFQQSDAPIGWTKQVTHNDKALRVVSGLVVNGGATPFTTVFGASKTTGGTAITVSQMPTHNHFTPWYEAAQPAGGNAYKYINSVVSGTANSIGGEARTVSTGSGNTHNHTVSLDIQYVDLIIASKD